MTVSSESPCIAKIWSNFGIIVGATVDLTISAMSNLEEASTMTRIYSLLGSGPKSPYAVSPRF